MYTTRKLFMSVPSEPGTKKPAGSFLSLFQKLQTHLSKNILTITITITTTHQFPNFLKMNRMILFMDTAPVSCKHHCFFVQ